MADFVGKNYTTGKQVIVAVDDQGVVQIAAVGASQSSIPPADLQGLRDEIAVLRSAIQSYQSTM